MRDYGKVYTSFWTSSNIQALSEDGRMLALYLLTCPHGTIAGVFRLPYGYACEDLQWSADRVKTTLSELFENGFAAHCESTKWVWVIQYFRWNPPENPNQRKAIAKVVEQVPDSCAWRGRFIGECGEFFDTDAKKKPFRNPFGTLSESGTGTETGTGTEQDQFYPAPYGRCPYRGDGASQGAQGEGTEDNLRGAHRARNACSR